MPLNYKRIGKRVQLLRKTKHLSQASLAEMTGLSVAYISHIETATRKASLQSLISIAGALDVTIDQLLNENQSNVRDAYKTDLHEIISDCNGFERCVLYDMATAVKTSLREHSDLYPRDHKLE